MNRIISLATTGLALAGLVACENVDSSDVLTSGVYADITARASGDGETLVKTTLRVGGAASNTFLDLVDDDKLIATQAEQVEEMERKTLLGSVWYQKSFAIDAADTAFKVAFERTIDEGAPDSNLTLPAPFSVTSPAAATDFSRSADDIVLSWDGSGTDDLMVLNIDGGCIKIFHKELAGDTGSYTVAHDEIELARDAEEGDSCDVTILLERRRAGQLDPGYGEGGQITGIQSREVKINSVM